MGTVKNAATPQEMRRIADAVDAKQALVEGRKVHTPELDGVRHVEFPS